MLTLAAVVAALVGVLGSVAVAYRAATMRGWRPAAALAIALVAVGVCWWLVLIAWFLNPFVGAIVSVVVTVGTAVLFGVLRVWRSTGDLLTPVLLTFGLGLVYAGILMLWGGGGPFDVAAARFSPGGLPADNTIPALFAQRFALGESTASLLGDWNGGDRPPLQSGAILQFAWPWMGAGIGATPGSAVAFAVSFAAQMLWVVGLIAVLRAWGASRRAVVIATLATAATGTMLLNSTFTWPKLFATALVAAAIALLLESRHGVHRTPAFALAMAAFTLGLLAHGAAVFVAPLALVLGVVVLRRFSGRQRLRAILMGTAGAAVLYVPWVAYQRFIDPPGDRLLKWHLAGVIPIDGRSFGEALVDSYSALDVAQIVGNKVGNLALAFDLNLLEGLLGEGGRDSRLAAEFYRTTIALGVALPLAVALVFALLLRWVVTRRAPQWRDARWIAPLAGAWGCVVIWCLVLFGPDGAVVHQGSHFPIVLLIAFPFAWLATRSRMLALGALALQIAATAVLYVPPLGEGRLGPAALLMALVGLGIVLATAAALPGLRARWAAMPNRRERVGVMGS